MSKNSLIPFGQNILPFNSLLRIGRATLKLKMDLAGNFPIHKDTAVELQWDQYGECKAIERMQRHCCNTLCHEANILNS